MNLLQIVIPDIVRNRVHQAEAKWVDEVLRLVEAQLVVQDSGDDEGEGYHQEGLGFWVGHLEEDMEETGLVLGEDGEGLHALD